MKAQQVVNVIIAIDHAIFLIYIDFKFFFLMINSNGLILQINFNFLFFGFLFIVRKIFFKKSSETTTGKSPLFKALFFKKCRQRKLETTTLKPKS